VLEQHYANQTPAFRMFVSGNVETLREDLTTSLEGLSEAFATLEDGVPEQFQERWEACDAVLSDSSLTLDGLEAEGGSVLATFRTLGAPGRLLDQAIGCVEDPAFKAISDRTMAEVAAVRGAQARMRTGLMLIDERDTTARAASALRPARRVLDRFFHELTLASIAPVVLFDAARLGASGDIRYALGGGVRLSLVSTVHVTAAYAVNPDIRPGERRGAFLFSLDVSEFLF
jgi:hypothetical protein